MRRLLLAALLGVSALVGAGEEPKCYFGFFMKGEGKVPADQEAVKKMQEDHLKNLTKVMLNNGGLAAGPLNDPTKERRGIVCFQATSVEDGLKNFADDPFVSNKIMSVELFEWKVDPKLFNIKKADPNGLAEYLLVIFKPGMSLQPVNDAAIKAHKDFVKGLTSPHMMRAHGEVSGKTKMREVAIFETKNAEAVGKALAEDPMVKNHLLEVEILPLWMSKGIFGN